jgi:hypothetical protein
LRYATQVATLRRIVNPTLVHPSVIAEPKFAAFSRGASESGLLMAIRVELTARPQSLAKTSKLACAPPPAITRAAAGINESEILVREGKFPNRADVRETISLECSIKRIFRFILRFVT